MVLIQCVISFESDTFWGMKTCQNANLCFQKGEACFLFKGFLQNYIFLLIPFS